MLNYLARHGYLVPNYGGSGPRGRTRYYSYRDLVVARVVQKLLDVGLEISRLKTGISSLSQHPAWSSDVPEKALRMLATDGHSLFFLEPAGTLIELTQQGQLAFAFVLDVAAAQAEVKKNLSAQQLAHFTLHNRARKYATPRR
jgi:DNA-binding transcriptional MerR regulator